MRITAKEYAKRFGVGIATVYRHIKSGKLPSKRIDGVAYVIIENENGSRERTPGGESATVGRFHRLDMASIIIILGSTR